MSDTAAGTGEIVFHSDLLHDLTAALQREWLVANGIGGYASATLAGANTRHYHGLLVAALDPPLGRAVLLAKLDETLILQTNGANGTNGTNGSENGPPRTYELGVNLYPDVVHPQGYQLLEEWHLLPAPTRIWQPTPGLRLEQRIWMAWGRNVTYLSYHLAAAPPNATLHLEIVPLIAWRDYHSEMVACDVHPETGWTGDAPARSANRLRLTLPPIRNVTAATTPLTLRIVTEAGEPVAGTEFHPAPGWYYRFQHPRERERGLEHSEDLYTPGTLRFPLNAGETVVVVAEAGDDLPAIAPQQAWQDLLTRQDQLRAHCAPEDDYGRLLTLAADAFVVQVPGRRTTVIAGYPWFSDWGRDTMIALPGLCLTTGRAEVALEILRSFAQFVDGGMIPNRFPDAGETPEYNTVDATLWYLVAIGRYLDATGDTDLVRELWPVLEEIAARHRAGTRYNIHVDPADDLLYAGQPGVQLTWMDAKVGDWVVTPRIGKPVEINALWISALHTLAGCADRLGAAGAATTYRDMAGRTQQAFATRFVRQDGRGLYDVLDTPQGNGPDSAVRPNQIFALSLPHAPIPPDSPVAKGILNVVREELLTPVGLRTLSPHDPAYRPRYEGGPLERDGAYHQGTVWPWLLGPYVEAYLRVTGDRQGARALLLALRDQLGVYGVGSLAEIYDGADPHRPNGCIAQAWSIAETLRVCSMVNS